ncbi:hypothetical protein [Methylocaldum szegediense]|uniref:hypothetical protein n=1 Tax=Methylocaldum szegediense TaxID=73780 RepID=UPI00047D438B|nr:hypothetical protein [Methylocaldum szegediense]
MRLAYPQRLTAKLSALLARGLGEQQKQEGQEQKGDAPENHGHGTDTQAANEPATEANELDANSGQA